MYAEADELFFHFCLILHSCCDLGQFLIVRPLENAVSNGDLTGDIDYKSCRFSVFYFLCSIGRSKRQIHAPLSNQTSGMQEIKAQVLGFWDQISL